MSDIMGWITPEFEELVEVAKKKIKKELSIEPKAQIHLTDKEGLIKRFIEELEEKKIPEEEIQLFRKKYITRTIGKYFSKEDEILILSEEGEDLETIIHEFLHSIQKCRPNREGIVDYLTFKITGTKKYIEPYELENWLEIEKTNGYKKIKERLLTQGDCEEF